MFYLKLFHLKSIHEINNSESYNPDLATVMKGLKVIRNCSLVVPSAEEKRCFNSRFSAVEPLEFVLPNISFEELNIMLYKKCLQNMNSGDVD